MLEPSASLRPQCEIGEQEAGLGSGAARGEARSRRERGLVLALRRSCPAGTAPTRAARLGSALQPFGGGPAQFTSCWHAPRGLSGVCSKASVQVSPPGFGQVLRVAAAWYLGVQHAHGQTRAPTLCSRTAVI